jgi:hypothetical protein
MEPMHLLHRQVTARNKANVSALTTTVKGAFDASAA